MPRHWIRKGRTHPVQAPDFAGGARDGGSRKFADLAWAKAAGCDTLEIDNLAEAGDFDVIFNTVPVLLFGRDILKEMDKETLLIDLASRPGGVDFNAAAELQIKTIWALSLPGRVAPKTAGAIIKKTILNMVKEGAR